MKTYVALVVGAIRVDAVPARREEGLSTQTSTRAGKFGLLRTRVQTSVGDGPVLELGVVVSASERITYDHSELGWRGDGRGCAVAVLTARGVVASTGDVVGSLTDISSTMESEDTDDRGVDLRRPETRQFQIAHPDADDTAAAASSYSYPDSCRTW